MDQMGLMGMVVDHTKGCKLNYRISVVNFCLFFPLSSFAFAEFVHPHVYLWKPHMQREVRVRSDSFTG